MDWITGIQRALDYTEEHLTGKVDYETAARQACSSAFHFQRMFSMLCGFTLGDYIRMRRLALAAEDLIRTDEKIIDLAATTPPRAFLARSRGSTASRRRKRAAAETSNPFPDSP